MHIFVTSCNYMARGRDVTRKTSFVYINLSKTSAIGLFLIGCLKKEVYELFAFDWRKNIWSKV